MMTDEPGPRLSSNLHRAPSHKKPKMPSIVDLAARIAAGELLEDIADELQRRTDTLRFKITQAGFSAVTGLPAVKRELDEHVALDRPFAYPPWVDQAACSQTDPEAFFPEKGGSTSQAKAVCARCPVAAECTDYALENNERFGIWGGLSERERRKVLRSMNTPSGETA